MDEVLHGDGPTKPVIGEPALDREVCMFLAPSIGLDDSVDPDVYVELGLEPYQAAGALRLLLSLEPRAAKVWSSRPR